MVIMDEHDSTAQNKQGPANGIPMGPLSLRGAIGILNNNLHSVKYTNEGIESLRY